MCDAVPMLRQGHETILASFHGHRTGFLSAASLLALSLYLAAVGGCSRGGGPGGGRDGSVRDGHGTPPDFSEPQEPQDLAGLDLLGVDLRPPVDMRPPADLAMPRDLAMPPDLAMRPDLAVPVDMATGPVSGGPCISGSTGATAFRVRWTDGGGGRPSLDYEVHGLPDKMRWKVAVYGYVIGFTPKFVDPFLGSGGVALDSSSFIDVELSTVGVSRISRVTLSVFGRSYSTGSSGSFNWITFTGGGATALNFVSNVAPYRWYSADATADIPPSDGRILLRIKAGGSSNSLVVNRLELCIDPS